MKKPIWYCLLAILLAGKVALPGHAAPADKKSDDVLLATMQQELERAQGELKKQNPAPYFLAYSVHDQDVAVAMATQGSLTISSGTHRRMGDVIMRVGSPALDNSHQEHRGSAVTSVVLPVEDDADAIARSLWRQTYLEYRRASEAFLAVKARTQVNAAEEDTSPDFSQEKAQVYTDSRAAAPAPDQAAIEEMVRADSAMLRKYPYIYESAAYVTVVRGRRHFVSSEGARLVTSDGLARLMIIAQTRADDGMELMRVETAQAESVKGLPTPAEMAARIEKMAQDLKALREAPVAEPFSGPSLLSGSAAAVFFHEVLGHRLEAQRQRGENEGQTFTKRVGQAILPEFLSVADDPTRRVLDGNGLSGSYAFDDEGIPATKVDLVVNGMLKNFLMARTPIKGFSNSNGHGRGAAGNMPLGRQGNLIVTSSRTANDAELRQRFIEEIKKQGKPYGLYFADVQGGFTVTERASPQLFQVLPIMVWRVYPDGRPDELVRGIDVVGTPLTALEHILLTGDKVTVFNGECGAESGVVPVAAAAPAMLLSEIEVQKRAHGLDRPPILPPPDFDPDVHAAALPGGERP
jgi:predicted Zn-dependent protease